LGNLKRTQQDLKETEYFTYTQVDVLSVIELFNICTGGIFGLYDGRITEMLKSTPATNRISVFSES